MNHMYKCIKIHLFLTHICSNKTITFSFVITQTVKLPSDNHLDALCSELTCVALLTETRCGFTFSPMASDVSWLWCIMSHTRLVALTRAESGTAVMALFWRYKYFTREGMVGMTVRPRPSQYMATGKEGGQSHSSGHAPPAVSACREPK